MRVKLCFFFVLVTSVVFAQESGRSALNGRISANMMDLEGIYVINLKTEKSTITEKDGHFLIAAAPGDTLLFSAIHLKEVRFVLEKKDFQADFVVKMESSITSLKEVVVKRYDNINAVDLGISPKGILHRTQAERRLYTAKSTPVFALINSISGRTSMLKKELEVEGKLSFIDQIDSLFEEDYFRKTLNIPAEYVKGFKYYIVENERFTTVLKSRNKTQIEFVLVALAEKYNEILLDEK